MDAYHQISFENFGYCAWAHVRFGPVPGAAASGQLFRGSAAVCSAGCVLPGDAKQSLSRMSAKRIPGMNNHASNGGHSDKYMFSPTKSAMG